MNVSFLRGLAVPSGITVSALKETPLGDVEGRDPVETAKMGWGEDRSLSYFWNYFEILHGNNLLKGK